MRPDRSLAARLRNAIPYAVLLGGAAYLYANAAQFARMARPGELGPDVWPRAILVLLMLVCVGAIAHRLLSTKAQAGGASMHAMTVDAIEGDAIDEPAEREREPAAHPYRLLFGIVLSIAYVGALEWLGFFVDTAIYLGVFMALGRYRRAGIIVSTSVLGSLAFVFVFMRVVYVSLPLGLGPFQAISVAILSALGVR